MRICVGMLVSFGEWRLAWNSECVVEKEESMSGATWGVYIPCTSVLQDHSPSDTLERGTTINIVTGLW